VNYMDSSGLGALVTSSESFCTAVCLTKS